jgi:hypothetical protein
VPQQPPTTASRPYGLAGGKSPHALRDSRVLWHNHLSVMQNDSHRSTSSLAGLAGSTSYAGGSWRYYAWRFI